MKGRLEGIDGIIEEEGFGHGARIVNHTFHNVYHLPASALVIIALPLVILGLIFGDGFWSFLGGAISFIFNIVWTIVKFIFEGIWWIISGLFDLIF